MSSSLVIRCPKCSSEVTVDELVTATQRSCQRCGCPLDDVIDPGATVVATPNSVPETVSLDKSAASSARPELPAQLSEYRIVREIARGGMGIVYQAVQTKLGRSVALKVIRAGELATDVEVQRFHQEAEAAAQLEHPGIVPIYDVGECEGQHFFSMGYVEGSSLQGLLRSGPLAPRHAAQIVTAVAQAVHYAHSRGIVHRDLKPANILIDRAGQPKVTDFGLAKRSDADSHITRTGEVMGTPSYMPPEQAAGRLDEIGPLSDVYSLGGVLYALLTGRPPFQAAHVVETLRQVLELDPIAPRQLNPAIPRDLETICLKCLEKSPPRRYSSAQSLADDLERYLRNEPIEARPVTNAERTWRWCRRNPALAGTLSAAAALAVVIIVLTTVGYFREARLRKISENATLTANRSRAMENAARTDADRQRAIAEQQREAAIAEKHAAETELARGHVEQGHFLCLQGEVAHGLLWKARGLHALPEGEPVTERLIRHRIGAWEPRLPVRIRAVRHNGPVTAVRFSPDGRWFVTASRDRTARIWETATGRPLSPPLPHATDIMSVDVSTDGRQVLTAAAYDKIARIWIAPEGAAHERSLAHTTRVLNAVFAGTGTIVTRTADNRLHFWNAATGMPRREPVALKTTYGRLAAAQDGKSIVVADGSELVTFDLAGNESGPRIPCRGMSQIRAVEISPDGKTLVAAGVSGNSHAGDLRTWKLDGERPLLKATAEPNGAGINGAAFSPDGKWLVTAALNGTAERRSAGDHRRAGLPLHADGAIRCVAYHPHEDLVLTGGDDGQAILWSLPSPEPLVRSMRHHPGVYMVAFSPDDRHVVSAGMDGTVRIWNAETGAAVGMPLQHAAPVIYVAFSSDGRWLASGSQDSTARLWNTADWTLAGDPLTHPRNVTGLDFSPDGRLLLTGCEDGIARLWDVATRQLVAQTDKHPGRVFAVRFSRTGERFVTGSGKDTPPTFGDLRVWDTYSCRPIADPLPHGNLIFNAAFNGDGTHIATACCDHAARIWDFSTSQPVGRPLHHPAIVFGCAFSRPETYLATACQDGRVRFWDLETRRPFGPDFAHDDATIGLWFSSDGRRLATGSFDGGVRIWHAPQPAAGTPSEIEHRIERATGLRLSKSGELERIDADTWTNAFSPAE